MSEKAIGMMDGAFFISRTELLNWMNDILNLSYVKLDEASNGAAFCQIVDIIFPGKVPMSRVNFNAKLEYEFIKNYKILQDSFSKLGVQKAVDVNRLSKGKFQDTLEFCQWLKKFYDTNVGPDGRPGYDPVSRRAGHAMPSDVGGASGPIQMSSGGSSGKIESAGRGKAPAATPHSPTGGHGTLPKMPAARSGSSNNLALQELQKQNAEMKETMDGIERERNFYFDKLRDIEIICQQNEENPLMQQILKILYATEGEYTSEEGGTKG